MLALLLILLPLLTGIIAFFFRDGNAVRNWALFSSIATMAVSVAALTVGNEDTLHFSAQWLGNLGSSFTIGLDGMGQLLTLLTAISFPLIFIATWNSEYKNANQFFGLMLLSQAGLMGVFLALDALLFYFFWELALIPAYFLCSIWGGARRIAVTFKFFIYTFTGSVLMLIGILYLYFQTPGNSFSMESFYQIPVTGEMKDWVFWVMFIAFAIKMPVFPFHTWQPDTYEQSPTAVTMVLSGVMVKMGVFAVLRWLLPVLPAESYQWGNTVMMLAVIGMIYASLLAMQQDDIKRLVAYSSIAHIGLMCVTIFAETAGGMQGVMIQMFNHGVNIIALWIVIELIERQFGTRKMSELGGLAKKAPAMAILLVVVALANIALPLTNAFIGEFMMFNGIFSSQVTEYNVVFTVVALVSIILSAVYTLNMLQKVLYGDSSKLTENAHDIRFNEIAVLSIIVVLIFWVGVYPEPLLALTQESSDAILREADVTPLLMKK